MDCGPVRQTGPVCALHGSGVVLLTSDFPPLLPALDWKTTLVSSFLTLVSIQLIAVSEPATHG